MVKGMTRQVVVVRAPEQKLFEQAIFLVRPDVQTEGVTDTELLRQAREAAGVCVTDEVDAGKRERLRTFFGALTGGALVGLAWILTVIL